MSDAPAVYRGSEAYPPRSPGPVVTIGNFDGVHVGHRALVARAVARARAAGVPSLAYTFDPSPSEVLSPAPPERIQPLSERVEALGAAGIDEVVVESFTRELGARGARWFAHEVIGRRLQASAIVVGWDFRFGRGREGTAEALSEWLGVPVEQVEAQQIGGVVVSSTRVREALRAGHVHEAATLLGRAHVVSGPVRDGDRRGRELGFPTANVAPEGGMLPADGVYAVLADLGGGELRPAVANLGMRPTFGDGGRRLEVHVLDYSGDLYGRTLRVHFVARLRGERAFSSADELVRSIHADVHAARQRLGAA